MGKTETVVDMVEVNDLHFSAGVLGPDRPHHPSRASRTDVVQDTQTRVNRSIGEETPWSSKVRFSSTHPGHGPSVY